MFGRRKRDDDSAPSGAASPADAPAPLPTVDGPRANGPWDASERPGEGEGYLDFGALRVRGRVGLQVQIPQETGKAPGAVVLMSQDSGLELRAFAAARSTSLWDQVRPELAAEVDRLEGTHREVEGPYGTELHVRVPAKTAEGEEAFQPSRIVGVDGPRWMLRATFLGKAALEPDDEGLLMQALRDVVVVRGEDPRPVREPLLVEVPQQVRDAVDARQADAAPAPDDDGTREA